MTFDSMNDIDMKNWKEDAVDVTEKGFWVTENSYFDKFIIPDDSRWDNTTSKQLWKDHHGIFIHEIPYQMIRRYSKKGETVWDPFGGTGTTYDVAKSLGVDCITNDLVSKRPEIQVGDSKSFNPGKNVQLVVAHPPYADIVKYNSGDNDLSNHGWEKFLDEWKQVVENIDKYLDEERFFVLVCGDLYRDGQFVPLGYKAAEIIASFGYRYKGHIVKDYGETKGGWKQKAQLERYR
jgi:DNA modification methylase